MYVDTAGPERNRLDQAVFGTGSRQHLRLNAAISNAMTPLTDAIRASIREILLSDWDPADASRSEYAHGLYDRFIDPLWPLIDQGDEGHDRRLSAIL